MPRSVNRRRFLKGAAAGAAALVAKPSAAEPQTGPQPQARAASATPLPGARLAAAETSTPPRADV
jgi:hypothetical protein